MAMDRKVLASGELLTGEDRWWIGGSISWQCLQHELRNGQWWSTRFKERIDRLGCHYNGKVRGFQVGDKWEMHIDFIE
jgi:hypothetical protein